ncbi:MAG TPA: family 16 glycoside hydrolase [Ktedonobacteraceae bacterium]|nr:family 16 glycoside hydrolase [Ktedonobacteraceae bacterium]
MSKLEQRHKKRNVQAIFFISIITLLLVILTSGVLIFYYGVGNKSGHTRGNVTATPQHGTPISTGQSITKPLFADNFSDPSQGWAVGSASGYTRVISNSTLTLANENHTTLTESLPTNLTFDDFSLTVTFTLLQATADDSVGLYVRGDTNLDHDYRIDFYGNSAYAITKEYLDKQDFPQESPLQTPTYTAFLRPMGEQNTVTVMMKGPVMVIVINKKVIHSVTDDDYTNGQIALFVHNSLTSNEVEAAFSAVVVYPAPVVLPG